MTDRARRDLHPGAWWAWALLVAAGAATTTNVLVLALLAAAVLLVVAARRTDAPWALAFRQYLFAAAIVLALRVVLRVLFSGGEDVLASAAAGVADGMRLALLVVCAGAANALASPRRLIASLPAALHEAGTAVVIALSVFPQLADSARRVHRARVLRGDAGRWRSLHQLLVPVLEDAFDRSLALAASMDSRGYGRSGSASVGARRVTAALLLTGLLGLCVGMYALLDARMPRPTAYALLAGGIAFAFVGLHAAGRRVQRTRYRRTPWGGAEWIVAASGAATLVALVVAARVDPAAIDPVPSLFDAPPLPVAALLAPLLAAAPGWLAPPPVEDGAAR